MDANASQLMANNACCAQQNETMGTPLPTAALPWTVSSPLAVPQQLGDGMYKDLLEAGLQRLIACDGVGAVLLFGSRRWGRLEPIPTWIWP